MILNIKVKQVLLPLIAMLILAGCYYDKADELYPEPDPGGGGNTCDTTGVSYASIIKPVIEQYCSVTGCHDNVVRAATYDLTSYSGLKSAADNNRLLGAINHQSGFVSMPQGMTKLSDCDINKITAWVNQGKLNN